MIKRRVSAIQVEAVEERIALSTIGFDHIVAPRPAGSLAPSSVSLQGTLGGAVAGSTPRPRGTMTTQFAFAGSLADPGPVHATLAITTDRVSRLVNATIALKNSLGSIRLVSHAGDYLGTRQTATTSAFGALYQIQAGTGSYAHLHGKGTFVLVATPGSAATATFQLQLTPNSGQPIEIRTY